MSAKPIYTNQISDDNAAKLQTFARTTGALLDAMKNETLSPSIRMAWRSCVAALGDLKR